MIRSAGIWCAALAVLGAAWMGGPAQARVDVGISIGVPAVGFDYGSGGYCDEWGCPEGYWDFPVYYGPVYWGGGWYRGPVYYRYWHGRPWYWVHGGWRLDQWRGPRPAWWGHYRYGRALGFDWYRSHGFRIPARHEAWWRAHGGRGWDGRVRDRDRDWRDRDRDRRDRDRNGGMGNMMMGERHHHDHGDNGGGMNGGGMGGGHHHGENGGDGGEHHHHHGG